MSFEVPIWLTLTPLLLMLFGSMLVYGFRRRDALLSRFAASRLLDQLTEQASRPRSWIKAACVLLAIAAIGLALARPQYGVEWSERKARGLDIIFVLDSSKSMLATDLRPTRLDRAKLAIIDLVERLESDRIGLVAFAGQAFLQTPPTLDYSAFRESLDAVDPGIMTSGGSDLGTALKEAAEAFPTENNVKVVVLLTDGEDLGGRAIEAAKEASSTGIQVFAIGIGTPEGEYLKIRNSQGIEEFVRDADGQPVRSQLDEPTLQQIAQFTGGSYSRLSSESLDQLYRNVIATLPREERESELQEVRIERYQWALSAAVLFLVVETLIRRRRSAAIHASVVLLTALTFSPSDLSAQTEEPQDARSLYNSAYQSLSAGEYETAAQLYESALSKTQDLKLQRDALYNLGHATYQQGLSTYQSGDPQGALEQVKKAESLFQSAQEIDPTDPSIEEDLERIAQVRAAIEQLLEQQQNQENPEQQPQDSEDSENTDESDQKQDSQQNQGDSGQDQKQDQNQEASDQSEEQDSQSGQDSNNQEQNNQENQNADSSQESESDQNQNGSQSDASQDSQNTHTPSDQEDEPSPSDASSAGEPEQREADNSNSSEGAPQESTQDPVDDIPQPQPGEESEDAGDEPAGAAGQPEPTEGDTSETGASSVQMSDEPVEGMTEAEAAALLDSLRSKETLLPFIDATRSGRPSETRDW